MNVLPGTPGVDNGEKREENASFTQDDLELQWMSMCNRMPQNLVGIATRMKNMTPVITELPKVAVTVGNELIRDEMEKIRGSILSTLKMYLHNSGIELDIQVAEQQGDEKVLSRREQFEELTKNNAAVEKLRSVFDLELA
jgi:DNA polymerase-3 subunit gamma/tau